MLVEVLVQVQILQYWCDIIFDMSNFDILNFEISNFDMSNFDMSKLYWYRSESPEILKHCF